MFPFARSSTRFTALIAAVLVSLVMAHTLGLLHRLAHGGGGAVAGVAAVGVDSHAADGLKRLFAGHDKDSGACDLYDQLTHADALWSVPALVLPVTQPATPAEPHASWHIAAQSAGFLARGPPALV
ncbi:hypothetical protein [Piscinibacter sp. XHJ-5]|uniref:hypothetical protein n=1 Tax=Piscinibacter sp. XHJ-5 TaxID=3037797 RepID=UPI002452C04F|nr:hypothetical protein [Piscinibacter sp. XHJ-5]